MATSGRERLVREPLLGPPRNRSQPYCPGGEGQEDSALWAGLAWREERDAARPEVVWSTWELEHLADIPRASLPVGPVLWMIRGAKPGSPAPSAPHTRRASPYGWSLFTKSNSLPSDGFT